MFKVPDFMKDAKNVYRTRNYIIKQDISFNYDLYGNTNIHSDDTYYLRNKKLDKEFDRIFADRKNLNGKRICTITHTKKYKF